ncbi:MAG TPA: HRDC domain-containing protein [Gammaproteobacteria bacterium]
MARTATGNDKEARDAGLVADPAALARLAEELEAAPLVAVDTEFVRERTYYPRLCLIQIASERSVACIDCLAGLDLEPLFARLFAPERTWLVHSARQDLEVIWHAAGRLPARLIDTQIAAALAGYPPQAGLETLLARELGVDLGESYARTDWSRRPLPAAALAYARDDVLFLLPAWERLERRLAELGRLAWLEEDSARLLAEPPVPDALAVWNRLKGVQHLDLARQAAALALVEWREAAAQRADRPRRWLLADETLVAIAAALPTTLAALEAVPQVDARLAARRGAQLLAAVARGSSPEIRARLERQTVPERPDKQRFKRLQQAVRERAAALGLHAELLATRRDIAALAAGVEPERVLKGWRAAALAPALA